MKDQLKIKRMELHSPGGTFLEGAANAIKIVSDIIRDYDVDGKIRKLDLKLKKLVVLEKKISIAGEFKL